MNIKELYIKYKKIINPVGYMLMGLIFVYLLLLIFVGDPRYLKDNRVLLKEYQIKIDSANKVNQDLNKQVQYFQSKDTFYVNEIQKNKGKTEVINHYYQQKIYQIDDYDSKQLEDFFKDRYK